MTKVKASFVCGSIAPKGVPRASAVDGYEIAISTEKTPHRIMVRGSDNMQEEIKPLVIILVEFWVEYAVLDNRTAIKLFDTVDKGLVRSQCTTKEIAEIAREVAYLYMGVNEK